MVTTGLKRKLLIGFTVFYALAGIVIVLVANQYDDQFLRIALYVAGGLILLVSGIGLFGAVKEEVCLLRTFGVLLSILVGMNVIHGINTLRLAGGTKEKLDTMFQSYRDHLSHSIAMDKLQSQAECCGVDSPKDWIRYYPEGEFPRSCCPSEPHNEIQECTVEAGAYTESCLSAENKIHISYFVGGFVMTALEIAAIVFSCSLPTRSLPV